MITLYVLRHGQTETNAAKLFISRRESRLTEKGRTHAREAAKKIRADAERVDAMIYTPKQRTRESAEIVRSTLGECSLIETRQLLELSLGECDGKEEAQVLKRYPDLGRSPDYRLPGAEESHAEMRKRVLEFVYSLEAAYPNKTVVVITHRGPWSCVLGEFGERDWVRLIIEGLPRGPYKLVLENGECKEFKEL